ncbi:MAG: N(4)-(beta-N-acetylglucosaminyl)-L-asparaginase [Crocinitomicaceae bacterium]|nr:N(4)-(beta-N-acetylglucosaminyl)-L-asparaginase [Crocinitomicaceae bacterium]
MSEFKRRTFFKLGLSTAILGFIKPARAIENVEKSFFRIAPKKVVISTWNHGLVANKKAWEVLDSEGKSLDAVEQGVMVTENDMTNRSVGLGGRPDRDGYVTLDACIMDEQSRCGAVACVENIQNPIAVARKVMEETPHVMLVGEGAYDFARDQGFDKVKAPIKEVKKDWKEWKKKNKELLRNPEINHENHDTIGMLAMDQYGNISGACTTSGWAYKMHGRVGDSPIIGAGLFVDNEIGGACATGMGEAIVRIAGSHTVVELMRQGFSPKEACKMAVERIIAKHDDLTNLQCGFIAINKMGEHGGYSVYEGFDYALKTANQDEMVKTMFDRSWNSNSE